MMKCLDDAVQECTDTLLDNLDLQLKITEDECKDYRFDLYCIDNMLVRYMLWPCVSA